MTALSVRRHFALRHHLSTIEAALPVTVRWIEARAERYRQTATVAALVVVCDRTRYAALTRRPASPHLWGDADYEHQAVFIDPANTGDRGTAELVIAHEVAHHRWPSYEHRAVFFDRCQYLIDAAAGCRVLPRRRTQFLTKPPPPTILAPPGQPEET